MTKFFLLTTLAVCLLEAAKINALSCYQCGTTGDLCPTTADWTAALKACPALPDAKSCKRETNVDGVTTTVIFSCDARVTDPKFEKEILEVLPVLKTKATVHCTTNGCNIPGEIEVETKTCHICSGSDTSADCALAGFESVKGAKITSCPTLSCETARKLARATGKITVTRGCSSAIATYSVYWGTTATDRGVVDACTGTKNCNTGTPSKLSACYTCTGGPDCHAAQVGSTNLVNCLGDHVPCQTIIEQKEGAAATNLERKCAAADDKSLPGWAVTTSDKEATTRRGVFTCKDGAKCNGAIADLPHTCLTCKDRAECRATDFSAIADGVTTSVCDYRVKSCIADIVQNKEGNVFTKISRGCAEPDYPEECVYKTDGEVMRGVCPCKGPNCNRKTEKITKKQCRTCTGEQDVRCVTPIPDTVTEFFAECPNSMDKCQIIRTETTNKTTVERRCGNEHDGITVIDEENMISVKSCVGSRCNNDEGPVAIPQLCFECPEWDGDEKCSTDGFEWKKLIPKACPDTQLCKVVRKENKDGKLVSVKRSCAEKGKTKSCEYDTKDGFESTCYCEGKLCNKSRTNAKHNSAVSTGPFAFGVIALLAVTFLM